MLYVLMSSIAFLDHFGLICIELQLDYMTNVSAFFSEFLASAVLMCMVLAFGDSSNMPVPLGLSPLALFLLILGIGISLGMQTGTLDYLQTMNNILEGKYRLCDQSGPRLRSTADDCHGWLWITSFYIQKVQYSCHGYVSILITSQSILALVPRDCALSRCLGWRRIL